MYIPSMRSNICEIEVSNVFYEILAIDKLQYEYNYSLIRWRIWWIIYYLMIRAKKFKENIYKEYCHGWKYFWSEAKFQSVKQMIYSIYSQIKKWSK